MIPRNAAQIAGLLHLSLHIVHNLHAMKVVLHGLEELLLEFMFDTEEYPSAAYRRDWGVSVGGENSLETTYQR